MMIRQLSCHRFVVKGDKTPLLGKDWLMVLKLNWTSIFTVTGSESNSLKAVLENTKKYSRKERIQYKATRCISTDIPQGKVGVIWNAREGRA